MSAVDMFLAVKKWITDRISPLEGDSITLNTLKTYSEAYMTATELEMTLVCSQRLLVSEAETRCGAKLGIELVQPILPSEIRYTVLKGSLEFRDML
ncbi:hypothetical protein TNCV_4076151 [Trichonephila clavipes]|nr:hypothetical protein TNCV_4076151 [Trichonephila clavipes]